MAERAVAGLSVIGGLVIPPVFINTELSWAIYTTVANLLLGSVAISQIEFTGTKRTRGFLTAFVVLVLLAVGNYLLKVLENNREIEEGLPDDDIWQNLSAVIGAISLIIFGGMALISGKRANTEQAATIISLITLVFGNVILSWIKLSI